MHPGRIGAASWILACAMVSTAYGQASNAINDFESPGALESWRSMGGTLSLGPGHTGQGAVLTCRAASAEALWTPAQTLPKLRHPAISLWVRFPPEADVSLVATDSRGQTLRYPVPAATLEHPKTNDWQYVFAPLPANGRLVEAGIAVQSRAGAAVEGPVSFDDLRLREWSEIFSIDPAAQVLPPPPELSDLAPRLGVNIHLLQDDHSLDLARDAGFRLVRMDMLWSNVERGGRYRFFAYDALVRALEARGMSVLWILDYGHPDHGGRVPRTPPDVAAFGRFAEAAAAHFRGRNVRYEVWNEPNTSQFWAPSPNASEYATLLREAVTAIRRGDPSAKVSSGGVSRLDIPFLSRAVNPTLAAGLNAIGIHPYPQAGPETIAGELAILREWVARTFGERLEIWDTEWGYSSANAPKEAPSNGHTEAGRRRQASLAVRELLTVWAAGLPLAVWYDLRDDGPDPANPEHNYGLLNASGNEKPAMTAVRNLTALVSGRKYAGMLQETPGGVHAMRLDGSKDAVFILWNDRPGERRTVEFPTRGLISATDFLAKAVKSKDGPAGQVRVELDEAGGPIYLVTAPR